MSSTIRTIAASVALVALGLTGSGPVARSAPDCPDAQTTGCWDAPFSEGGRFDAAAPQTAEEAGELPTAVSAAVLPDGRIVYWDGLTGIEDARFSADLDVGRTARPDRSRVLDINGKGPIWLTPTPEDGGAPDFMFCADQRLLASGRLLVAGGTRYETAIPFPDEVVEAGGPAGQAELYGSENVRLYRPGAGGGRWNGDRRARDMAHKRWYPTLVTLANGRLLVASGVSKLVLNSSLLDPRATDVVPRNVAETETYNPRTDRWSDNGEAAAMSLPLFARMHLLPNREVFYGGAGQMFNPAGEDVDQLQWNFMKAYSPGTKAWRDLGIGSFGARSGAFQLMLPLEPPYDKAEFLIAGGALGVSPGLLLGTPLVEKVTVAPAQSGSWEASSEVMPMLNNLRWYSSGVLLPNGHVLALNGGDTDDVLAPGMARAVRTPELWDGTSWTQLAPGARDRVYHNTAMLLPDGSVLVGGHSPISRLYGASDGMLDDIAPVNNNLRDPSFERFYPPYLYAGNRPRIAGVPAAASHGDRVVFRRSGGPAIDEVVLTRLPSVTHTTDADQRTVVVAHTGSSDRIRFRVPKKRSVVPPGYYYLFALSGRGVPSIASIVRIA